MKHILLFAQDANDPRVRKRAQAFEDLGKDMGASVIGFTFHRGSFGEDKRPFWHNIDLGETFDRQYLQRIWALFRAMKTVFEHRSLLKNASSFYAINLDNALLAIFARFISRKKAKVVFENVDIQPVFLGNGLKSKLFRGIERWVLRHSNLLVTSSPTFVREYFQRIQSYRGEVFLLENKVYPSTDLARTDLTDNPSDNPPDAPWVVGYFGGFRCEKSWQIIQNIARKLPNTVQFYLRGYPTLLDKERFFAEVEALPNIRYEGTFQYPDELSEMYGCVHFSWGFDFYAPDGNSKWLLPTRLYDGGLFHVPMLAAHETATGEYVEEKGIGWTFNEPIEDELVRFFQSISVDEYKDKRNHYNNLGEELFRGEQDYRSLMTHLG